MLIHTLNLVSVTLACAFLNRWRGGWFDEFHFKNKFLKKIVTSQTLSRILITSICCFSIFFNLGFPSILEATIIFFLVLYFSLVAGWGTWFDIKSTQAWKHNVDAFWVELIMPKIMGKHWVPRNKETIRQHSWLGRYTIEQSPTSFERDESWCIMYNYFAMSLRGLGFGLIVTFIFCYLKEFNASIILLLALSSLMGIFYYIWHDLKANNIKLPEFINGSTKLGEFLWGGITLGGGLYFCSFLVGIS